MENEFVSYEIALALKELGFNEKCLKAYTEDYKTLLNLSNLHTNSSIKNMLPTKPLTAPLYQQAFRWFREKHNLHCNIDPWGYCIFDDNGTEKTGFETYEQAELECLKKLIEIVKAQK